MSNETSNSMSAFNWGLLLLLSLLWGGSFFFNGVAVKEMPVLSIVFSRVFLAALTLFVILWIKRVEIKVSTGILAAFFFMGLTNNLIPFSLIVYGQTMIDSGLSSVLNATTPLFAALVGHFATSDPNERLGPRRIGGIVLGIAGVGILLGPSISGVGFSGDEVWGQISILGAALSYGVGAVFGRKFGKAGVAPLLAATGQVTATSIMMLPIVLYIDQPWLFIPQLSTYVIVSVIALAVVSTGFAYIIYFHLISSAGATNASLVTLLIPVSAILLGVLFLDEKVSIQMLAGMAVIGCSLLVIDGRLKLPQKQKSPV